MVRLATSLALALSCAESMSVTNKLSQQLSHPTKDAPRNFLVLRLAHTGSSWITDLIGWQEDTYITREAMYPLFSDQQAQKRHLESIGAKGVLNYLERALREPCGNILEPDRIQYYCKNIEEYVKDGVTGESLVSEARSNVSTLVNPRTCACLKERGAKCPLKFLGMTLDPMSDVLKDHLFEILGTLQKKHPDMPVIMLRRTNVVKRSFATGGSGENRNGQEYGVPLHQKVTVDQFMKQVRYALVSDKVLRQAASYFPNVKTVTYERMFNDPKRVMNEVFQDFGMPGRFEDWMAEYGDKHTPDDLRVLISNFDEIEQVMEKASPCLTRQLRAKKNEEIYEICDDI